MPRDITRSIRPFFQVAPRSFRSIVKISAEHGGIYKHEIDYVLDIERIKKCCAKGKGSHKDNSCATRLALRKCAVHSKRSALIFRQKRLKNFRLKKAIRKLHSIGTSSTNVVLFVLAKRL